MVELMVAVVIGLFLVGVAAALYVGTKQSFIVQDNASHMQDSARAAIEDITREIRKAGSFGCFNWKAGVNVPFVTATAPYDSSGSHFPIPTSIGAQTVVGGGPVSGLTLPGSPGMTPVTGTDYLGVIYGQPTATLTIGSAGNGIQSSFQDDYPLNKSIVVTAGQPMAISDCDSLTIFRLDNGDGSTPVSTLTHKIGAGNNVLPAATNTFGSGNAMFGGNLYQGGAVVMTFEAPTFFVAKDNTTNVTSLYRWDTSGSSGIQPMIPNVEDMRVVFGVDTSSPVGYLNTANAWKSGAAVTSASQWGNVVSVAVYLKVRSDNLAGGGAQPADYTWDATNLTFKLNGTATDGYIHQVYVANAALHTRVPIM